MIPTIYTVIAAFVTAIAVVLSAIISSRYTSNKVKNGFMVEMQGVYQKIITDLQATNERLIEEREDNRKELNLIKDKVQTVMVEMAILKSRQCININCPTRVYP
jgi:hypothetical protein